VDRSKQHMPLALLMKEYKVCCYPAQRVFICFQGTGLCCVVKSQKYLAHYEDKPSTPSA